MGWAIRVARKAVGPLCGQPYGRGDGIIRRMGIIRRHKPGPGHRPKSDLERLGRWDGSDFVSARPSDIVDHRIVVIVHGWAAGMASTIDEADHFIRVWDTDARDQLGHRFDAWFRPFAEAVTQAIPGVEVLAYSWLDDSATDSGNRYAIVSQHRTTENGLRLSAALDEVLAVHNDRQVHLVGFSHGSKVAAVAAASMRVAPVHLTLLDSPDGVLPTMGGAMNDLASYLSAIAARKTGGERTFIDNYPSEFGARYSLSQSPGSVVDVILDPRRFPLDDAHEGGMGAAHRYAPNWYVESARRPESGVGFAWSRLFEKHQTPSSTSMRQDRSSSNGEGELGLVPAPHQQRRYVPAEPNSRRSRRPRRVVRLKKPGSTVFHSIAVRRPGDVMAAVTVRWLSGDDTAELNLAVNGKTVNRSVLGWGGKEDRVVPVALGGLKPGPIIASAMLHSDGPAEVEVTRALSIVGASMSLFDEKRTLFFPSFVVALTIAAIAVVALAIGLPSRLRRSRPSR